MPESLEQSTNTSADLDTTPKPGQSFESLGLIEPLLEAIERLNYKAPTDIQAEALPSALAGRDIIGVASTGSGKTAAFALPILQKLWDEPKGFFACVLAPTRELAYQISQQFEALGSAMGVRCTVLVGGMDIVTQSIALAKKPHIIVATPGRLKDHLENTKGFSLRSLRFLVSSTPPAGSSCSTARSELSLPQQVLDEADRLLDMDFGPDIDAILKAIPKERTTYLFSATMTTKVAKLQRASLTNPVRVEVSTKYSTVSTLLQYYLFIPLSQKDVHLVYLANSQAQNSIIVFTRTVHDAQRIRGGPSARSTKPESTPGFSEQIPKRIPKNSGSYGCGQSQWTSSVNFDIPTHSKDYIHRVGRTARAGRAGKSITLVTQYDVELIQRIEAVTGKKMDLWPTDKEEIALLRERVEEAGRLAATELREEGPKNGHRKRRKGDRDDRDVRDRDDDVVQAGIPTKKRKSKR
ncbi:DEAD-domain-containing protein [Lactarius vividus]|nr:DEAD-domain-containing protein [Lactarius vividus]